MKTRTLFYAAFTVSGLTAGLLLVRSVAQQIGPPANLSGGVWQNQDVGRTGLKGKFAAAEGRYSLQGAGADIWSGADAFHFGYVPWEGDGEFVAHVANMDKTDPWAKAGLMIRATVDEGSAHAMAALTPEKGATFIRRAQTRGRSTDDAHQAMRVVKSEGASPSVFQQRGSAGADRATDSIAAASLPRWIKLTRHGNTFTAYDSNDGTTWEWLGTDSVEMPAKAFVGLAVTSHDASRLCAVSFDHVSINQASAVALTPKVGSGDGLQGTYYPQMDFSGTSVRRIDPTVNFDWGYGAPAEGIGKNNFSVRWEGELEAQFSEPYAIHVTSDDRARLWLNGELIIDEWYEHAEQTSTAVVNLNAGQKYLLRLDYFENRGRAVARLLWSSPSTPQQIIPKSQLYSQITDQNGDGVPDLWELARGLNPTEAPAAGAEKARRKQYDDGFEPIPRAAQNAKLSANWISQDIGRVGKSGSVDPANGTWTVNGSGADIWANADSFHFVYQLLRGDGEIVARVGSQQNTDPWAKTGLMMRESLQAGSRHITLARTPEHGLVFLQRYQTGARTSQSVLATDAASPWLKLVRRGNVFSSFTSSDGANWQWIGTETIDAPSEILVGLAVNSHDNSALGVATFDNARIGKGTSQATSKLVQGSGDGLQAAYFDSNTGRSVSRIDPNVNFDWEIDAPVSGIGADFFSARWEGFLEAQSDELYALHIVADDGARLWLDGQLLIDGWSDHSGEELTAKVQLKTGRRYAIKLEFYERTGEAIAKLFWSTPTIPKQPIPQSQLYTTNPPRIAQKNLDPVRVQPADIGQTAIAVTSPETKPRATITNAIPTTTPQSATITGYTTVAEVPGMAAVARLGEWNIEGNSIFAVSRRGYLEYDLTAPAADIYRIEVQGATHNLFDADPAFSLVLSLDGEQIDHVILAAPQGQTGRTQAYTPWINAGVHRVRIFWDNARKGRSLKLTAVRLQSIQGPDSNKNGIKDWVEQKLKHENGIEIATTSPGSSAMISSLTSPAFIEGRGRFLSMMKISANNSAVPPANGAGNRWHANVPLPADQPATVEVSFQNGGLKETRQIVWQAVDLLKSQNLVIRKGDSLLFTVGDATANDLGNENAMLVDVSGVRQYSSAGARSIIHRFDKAGAFTVSGAFARPIGAIQRRAITVKVIDGTLGDNPVAWTARERFWDCPQLPAEAVLDHDPRLKLTEASANPSGGKTYRLKVDAGEDRWVLARLGEHGPVFASLPIRGIDIYGVSESGAFYGKTYEDGSRVVETAVAQNRVYSNVRVELQIIVGGVMFDDGSLVKTLNARDFDETGLANVSFLMPPGVQTSNCHVMRAWQNQIYLGEY